MSLSSALIAQADMIPEDSGGPYVIAAYVVFLVLMFVYIAIMAQRLTKISKMADDLEARLDGVAHAAHQGAGGPPAQSQGSVTDVTAAEPPTIAPAAPSAAGTTSTAGPSA